MPVCFHNLFLLTVLIAGLGLMLAGRVTAQTFTTLHIFTGGSDGANPFAGLITNSSGSILYGTAVGGGSSGNGTVFAINTGGTGFRVLHSFSAVSNNAVCQQTLGVVSCHLSFEHLFSSLSAAIEQETGESSTTASYFILFIALDSKQLLV